MKKLNCTKQAKCNVWLPLSSNVAMDILESDKLHFGGFEFAGETLVRSAVHLFGGVLAEAL